MRVAAFDCGTNAIRLLVADVVDGVVYDLCREMRIVRLGEGVDRTGAFAPAALARTFEACHEYAGIVGELGVVAMRFAATSASRDVRNRDAFVAGVQAALGIEPEVISGHEEAALSFTGALNGLPGVERPTLVVDIGGGSTEFVLGVDVPAHVASVDMGCVRMTERYVRNDPPSAAEMTQLRREVDRLITHAAERVPFAEAASMVGLAGSVTTVAAMALDLPSYDAARIHGSRMTYTQVEAVTRTLVQMTRAERAALPFMHPGRVDVIGSGATILAAVMAATGAGEVVVSEHDLLDGLALSIA